jgi:hypothetical protein
MIKVSCRATNNGNVNAAVVFGVNCLVIDGDAHQCS